MKKKRCTKCNRLLSLENFAKCEKRGTQPWCKECRKEYDKKYYKKNQAACIKRKKEGKARRRQESIRNVLKYLDTHPCVDCGETDKLVLTFDHVRGKKLFNISDAMTAGVTWKRIERELKKCEVRCANCHLRKTAKEQKWIKLKEIDIFNSLKENS
jgi:hypothetical protein